MPCKEMMYNGDGELIDAAPFMFNVELDELEQYCNVKLTLKPVDPCVVMTREYFDIKGERAGFERVKEYSFNFFYNEDDDKLVLNVFNGFDVALFNMSSLLGIGRVTLRDEVPYMENGFAPVHDKVSTISWTLEEFKMLDGWVAWFTFTEHFVYFKGVVIGANYIHEDVEEGEDVPDFRSDLLLRGEKLFLLD